MFWLGLVNLLWSILQLYSIDTQIKDSWVCTRQNFENPILNVGLLRLEVFQGADDEPLPVM